MGHLLSDSNADDSWSIANLREKLRNCSGKRYWRSLEELADTPQFRALMTKEFPAWHFEDSGMNRRDFLRVMGASLALAGLVGCSRPAIHEIVPYVRAPEEVIPGKPLFFATAMTLAGSGIGLLVESNEGRPTKIEGNPTHPGSLGATDVYSQASVLSLYDPDRSHVSSYLGDVRSIDAVITQISVLAEEEKSRNGAGLRLLTETVVSPTLADQIRGLLHQFPEAKWHQYEPINRDMVRQGSILAFGRYLNPTYRLDQAEVVLSLGSDFLAQGPGWVRYARDFMSRHSPQQPNAPMNRLYVMETNFSNTGSKADHRLRVKPSEMEAIARYIAGQVRGQAISADGIPNGTWLNQAARDLMQHRGKALVIAGEQQPPEVHAWAHMINHALGNFGSTVVLTEPIEAEPVDQMSSLRDLLSDIDAGRVQWLIIMGGNPVYNAPVDLEFGTRFQRVPVRMHLSQYSDETSNLCHWHITEAHYLEAWSDTRAFEGTASIVQPLIAPLWNGRSAHEFLAMFTNQPFRSGYDTVRDYWRRQRPDEDFEPFWRKSLNDGVIEGTALPAINVTPSEQWIARRYQNAEAHPAAHTANDGTLEVVFLPDPAVFDGRFANNAWLQELPKPITRITWDNAALVSPATAGRLGFSYSLQATGGEHGQITVDTGEFTLEGRSIRMPVWIVPGHADNCVTFHLGYGRQYAGRVGTGLGFFTYGLRTSRNPWSASGCSVRKIGPPRELACVQFHHSMEAREPVRAVTLADFMKDPGFVHTEEEPPRNFSLYPLYQYTGYAWGMTIDLNACVGCNSCVVACQAENNIPVVGQEEVKRGREMHWIRIDNYFRGSMDDPESFFQPVPCMQCENAPCEYVCPVHATTHSSEGLNDMTYNRCVGTRYCSNNCPYKVRRFNFFLYSDWKTPSMSLVYNPNVTVRSRGVMEKCTYCVQRINAGRIRAEEQDRLIRDGEIIPACAQACPTNAIVFGNINDQQSRVSKLKAGSRNYSLLAELNTQPRTTYLGAVRNANPDMPDGGKFGE